MLNRVFLFCLALGCAVISHSQLPDGCVIEEEFDSTTFSLISKNGKYGIFDHSGEVVTIPCEYDRIGAPDEVIPEHIQVWKEGKSGLSDMFGNEVLKTSFDSLGRMDYPQANFILAKKGGLYGLYDESGFEIAKPIYSYIEPFDLYLMGYARVMRDGLWGILSIEGVPPQCIYESLGRFDDMIKDMALIKSKGLFGFMDNAGYVIIQCQYENIEAFGLIGENIALVTKKGKMGVINPEGFELIPAEYDEIKKVDENVLLGIKKGQKTYFDNHGDEVEFED
jgi:hypothetical protein